MLPREGQARARAQQRRLGRHSYIDQSPPHHNLEKRCYSPSQLNPINHSINNALQLRNMIPHLARTNILPLPPKRIPHPIVEPHPPALLMNNQIPHLLPHIPLAKNIAHDLLLGSLGIAQILRQQRSTLYPPYHLARFIQSNSLTEPCLWVSIRLSRFINFDDKRVRFHKPS